MINWGEKKLKATGPFRTSKSMGDVMASFGLEGDIPLPGYRRFRLEKDGTSISVQMGTYSLDGWRVTASVILNGVCVHEVAAPGEEQWDVAELLSAILEDILCR